MRLRFASTRSAEESIRQSAATGSLLPAGSPTNGLVCAYDADGRLTLSQQLTSAPLSQLVAAIESLPLGPVSGVQHCPANLGLFSVLSFEYYNQPEVALFYQSTGCKSLVSGSVVANEDGQRAFEQFLAILERVSK